MMDLNDNILEGVLAYFSKLAAIPRPSGHERQVSDYLCQAFKNIGCKVIQDEVFNIIADLPATVGKEESALTILQGHMDMVCVASDGVVYNPFADAIKLVRTSEYLRAEGTSLGADDGIGVAEILYVFSNLKVHGPLRAIITVDEEVGMKGASFLASEHLMGAKYLINCDSEDYDVLTVGCAGSVNMDFSLSLTRQNRKMDARNWQLTVSGLKGGHSGERIGDGRANAIKCAIELLSSIMENENYDGLISLQGGAARNAIPSEARLVVAFNGTEQELEKIITDYKKKYLRIYSGIDNKICLSVQKVIDKKQPIQTENTASIIMLVALLHSGVFAMSPSLPNLVETSANLGTICTEDNIIKLTYFPRSSVAEKLTDIIKQGEYLARLTGFNLSVAKPSPAWKERIGSQLVEIMTDVFEVQNKKKMTVNTIHAGLECGFHIEKNPELDMVSIGVTTRDIHSPSETLLLQTVAPQVKLLMSTLQRIANEK